MQHNDMSHRKDDHHSRLASVGQIAAGIAHEVRNPLTAVKGFLQLLQEKSPHNYIDIAQQELENAISTLQNLLHISKPDTDDEPLSRFNLCSELEALLALFQDQVYRVTIEKRFEQTDIEIVGRKSQIKKAFFNILKNAFESIQGQGKICIRHYCDQHTVFVEISDTGVGIPKDKLFLLGTPFFTTKADGTGMGLAYVYSVIYQHGATIDVDSEEGKGTTFRFQFPLISPNEKGVIFMDLKYEKDMDLLRFFQTNKADFERKLLLEAVNIKNVIEEIRNVGNFDLVNNAHQLVRLLIENNDMELVQFAQAEGKQWAMHSALNHALNLEWFQAVRRVLWDFMYNYERLSEQEITRERFFSLERQINSSLDKFLRYFFLSFTMSQDEQLKVQKEMIDDLSAPIIPLTPSVAILPLLGTIDMQSVKGIQEKIFQQIGALNVRTLLIDMSAVPTLDTAVVQRMIRIADGVGLMGCKVVVTGIRPEIANTMVNLGISFAEGIQTKATLQQALEEIGIRLSS